MDDTNVYERDIVEQYGPMSGSESDDLLFGKERSVILFDMDTGEVQCRNYHEPGEEFSQYVGEPTESFIWRNQTLSPIYRPDPNTGSPPEGRICSLRLSVWSVLMQSRNH